MAVDTYSLPAGTKALLVDLDIDPANVLRRAELPADLFARSSVRLAERDKFAFWQAVEDETDDPNLPIRIAEAISPEVFEPALFAALVSPTLRDAAHRIATYKKLIGPVVLDVDEEPNALTLRFTWPEGANPPGALVLTELLFWVALTRIGTRQRVEPRRVTVLDPPSDQDPYHLYLGVGVEQSSSRSITFAAGDADRRFLMADRAMWEAFEPILRKRLSDIEQHETNTERVAAALVDLLPAGKPTMGAASSQLAVSPRTLQRRLRAEGTTFQAVLNRTRESLARHYLSDDSLSAGQIGFLLGYEEPSSFFRAFHNWTGQTPEQARTTATVGAS